MLLQNLKSRCLHVPVRMNTDSSFRVESSARSDGTIKQTHQGHKILSSPAAVSVWKPHDHALAPQILTSLWAGRNGIFHHCCAPSQFSEINPTEDAGLWRLN